MTKIKVYEEVATLYYDYTSVETVIECLQGYVLKYGAGNVSLQESQYAYDDNMRYIAVMVNRDETDTEYDIRQSNVMRCAKLQIDHEKLEFERLKKKYG